MRDLGSIDGQRRRCVCLLPAGVAWATLPALAGRLPRIALLPDPGLEAKAGFEWGFKQQGWEPGRDYQWQPMVGAMNAARLDADARSVVAGQPDLIITVHTSYALAARKLSRTIPIVMGNSGFPVEAGLANSLMRPGSNVTGNTSYAGTGIWGKLVALLREAKPSARRLAVLWDYLPPLHPPAEVDHLLAEPLNAAKSMGMEPRMFKVAAERELSEALAALRAWAADALLFTTGVVLWPQRARVLQMAVELRLPTATDFRSMKPAGHLPLIAYGPELAEQAYHATAYAVRILRDGARPAELPILQPSRFYLVLSARMAGAIGLSLPATMRLAATEVIE